MIWFHFASIVYFVLLILQNRIKMYFKNRLLYIFVFIFFSFLSFFFFFFSNFYVYFQFFVSLLMIYLQHSQLSAFKKKKFVSALRITQLCLTFYKWSHAGQWSIFSRNRWNSKILLQIYYELCSKHVSYSLREKQKIILYSKN